MPFEPRTLDDARTLRALAHPLRIALIDQLTFRGPLTATECAALVGESPSSCSFHLRTLAKYGFVEAAERGTGRHRPWRITSIGNRWESAHAAAPAERTAGRTLSRLVRDRDRQLYEDYLARSEEFEPEWSEAAHQSNFGGYLTPDELKEIGEALLALWRPYLERLGDGAEPLPGARLVHMATFAFPRADTLDEVPAVAGGDDVGEPDTDEPDTDPHA